MSPLLAALAIGFFSGLPVLAEDISREQALARVKDPDVVARNFPFRPGRPSDEARYVTLRDGTRIALFFHFPEGFEAGSTKVPVAFEQTIYGHREEISTTAVELYRKAGFAVVVADARGHGASFGNQQWDHDTDRNDARQILEWIAAQPWSNGDIAVIGLSISTTYADFMTGLGVPAVKAGILRAGDFDHYELNVFPGGVPNTRILGLVNEVIQWHAGRACVENLKECGNIGIQAVDGDKDYQQLRAAMTDHQASLPGDAFSHLVYRDDKLAGRTLADYSAVTDLPAIARAKVPARVSASWLDGMTADSALKRFNGAAATPMEVVIGATTHTGGLDADPFAQTPFRDARLNVATQFAADVDFAKRALAGATISRKVRYAVLGTDVWKETPAWPPDGMTRVTYQLAPGALVATSTLPGSTDYQVDPESSAGPLDRWTSQTGSPIYYGDLRTLPGKRLEFTSAPVAEDMELAGPAELCLVMRSDQTDGLVVAYLWDVAPDGRVSYLTEGLLRLLHRKTVGPPCDPAMGTERTFVRADGAPVTPGETMVIELPLLTTAALIRRGHSLRLALSGADKANFPMLTGDKLARWSVDYGGVNGSRLTVPLRPWSPQ